MGLVGFKLIDTDAIALLFCDWLRAS